MKKKWLLLILLLVLIPMIWMSGPKRGTYNYGHPSVFFGSLKHVIYDVIPHFVSAEYKSQKH